MKKVILTTCVLLTLILIPSFFIHPANSTAAAAQTTGDSGLINTQTASFDGNVLAALLSQETQRAVSDYYSQYLTVSPNTSPIYTKILNIKKSNGTTGANLFVVRLEVWPTVGAHDIIGSEQLTYWIQENGQVSLNSYKHVKSTVGLAQNYPNLVKKWPPQ